MINFNKDSVFNLTEINVSEVEDSISNLLLPEESVFFAFKTLRDKLVFTNKRIISIDIQGIVGMRKEYASLPYSKIQYFSIQTPGLIELVPDTELVLSFTDGFTAKFEFKSKVDIAKIYKFISKYVVEKYN